MLEKMLIPAGVNVNQPDNDNRTPIFFLFYKHSRKIPKYDPANFVMTLINMGQARLNVEDKLGRSPLHYACQVGSTISALTMMNNKAPLKNNDILGNTPLWAALSNGNTDLSIFLIQNDCAINIPSNEVTRKEEQELENFNNIIWPERTLRKFWGETGKQPKTLEEALQIRYKQKKVTPFLYACR